MKRLQYYLVIATLGLACAALSARAQTESAPDDYGLWMSAGVGTAERGLAAAGVSGWFTAHRIAFGGRLSDAETPVAFAASGAKSVIESSVMLGWLVTTPRSPVSVLLAGGYSALQRSSVHTQSQIIEESFRDHGPTVHGEIGRRLTRHIGIGLGIFGITGRKTSHVAGTLGIRIGRLPQ